MGQQRSKQQAFEQQRPDEEAGLVIRTGPGTYLVRFQGETWACKMRGRLKSRRKRLSDLSVCVGDRVLLERLDRPAKTALISEILPRRTSLSRLSPPPWPGAARIQQVLAVNIDLIVVVMAAVAPPLKINTIDRYLLLARQAGIDPAVCINKVDQAGIDADGAQDERAEREAVFATKANLVGRGVPVVLTSAELGLGIEELRSMLRGKTSVFAGPSGVGKTSLLKRICPGLLGKTLSINSVTGKGKHSTTFSSLIDIGGGYVADLPGIRAVGFWNLEEETVKSEFQDIEAFASGCRFSDCTHTHEPGCAVRAAVESGELEERRYLEYARIRREAGKRRGPQSGGAGTPRTAAFRRAEASENDLDPEA